MAEPDNEQRKPLLDLSDLVDRRDFIVAKDGTQHYLRTDGLGALQHHRLIHCSNRHDELFEKKPGDQTDVEKKEMVALVDEMLEIILDAPVAVRKQVKGDKARGLVRYFQRASQPEAEMMERLAMLAETLQMETATEPGTQSSIGES